MTESNPFGKLQGNFGKPKSDSAAIDYTHPHEAKMRELLETALAESPTGARLLKVAEQQKITIGLIKSKNASGFSPESRSVFVALPPELSTIPAEAVLELGAALRQAELHLLGVKNPDNSMPSLEYTVAYDTKMVDSITIMCKMTSELYEKGHLEFLDALKRMGHGEMYQTFVESGPGDEMVDVYYKVYDKKAD